jgi:hypothetical protein
MKLKDENYDYSKFDLYFEEREEPAAIIESLREMNLAYMQLTLCLQRQHNGDWDNSKGPETWPHDDALAQSARLADVIRMLESITANKGN